MVNNREDALEVVQDTFVKALRHHADLRNDSKSGSWLMMVARNTAIDYLRRRKRESVVFQRGSGTTVDIPMELYPEWRRLPPEEEFYQNQLRKRIREQVSRLTTRYKRIVTLFYLHEHTLPEMASILEQAYESMRMDEKAAAVSAIIQRQIVSTRITYELYDEIDRLTGIIDHPRTTGPSGWW